MRFTCSGDGPGTHEACDYATDSVEEAGAHFEATGHNLDDSEEA